MPSITRNIRAAFDLASVMVGVLVLSIITGAATITVSAVVPWTQDQEARTSLRTVVTAQAASKMSSDRYVNTDALDADGIVSKTRAAVETDPNGACYLAAVLSNTGTIFWTSSDDKTVKKFHTGDAVPTNPCVSVPVTFNKLPGVSITVPPVVPPATVLTSAQKIAEAEAAFQTANGVPSNSISAIEAAYGKPVLATGEAAKLLISPDADFSNLVVDGSFENETTGAARFPLVTGAPITRVTAADAPDGGSYIRATQNTAGSLQVSKVMTLDGAGTGKVIPAAVGVQYTVSAMARASFATNLRISVQFVNASGTVISTQLTGTDTVSTAGQWARIGGPVAIKSPANTAGMRITLGSVNYGAAMTTIDLDAVTVNVGYHMDVIGGVKTFYLPTYFTTRKQGWLAIIRNADGSTDYLTSEQPTVTQQFFPKTADVWATPTGNSVVVSGTTLFPVNLTPWAGQIGFGIGSTVDQTTWFNMKNQAWTIR